MQYDLRYTYAPETTEVAGPRSFRRTYAHLAGAILAFVDEAALLQCPERTGRRHHDQRLHVAVVLVAFMGVGYLADVWARAEASPELQYLAWPVHGGQAVIFCRYCSFRFPVF